jgi:predicted metal-binding protein
MVRDKDKTEQRVSEARNLYKIVSKIESMAFYDGRYLAFGLGAGSCLNVFCSEEKTCEALNDHKRCRYPLKARPSMEAVGIDVFKMIASAGWEIYPIGVDSKPEDSPKGTLAALVVIE